MSTMLTATEARRSDIGILTTRCRDAIAAGSEAEKMSLIGYLYRRKKGPHGGSPSPRSVGRVSQKIAQELGVSRATVERSGQFADCFDKLFYLVQDDILAGRVRATRLDVVKLAMLTHFKQLGAVEAVKKAYFTTLRKALLAITPDPNNLDDEYEPATDDDDLVAKHPDQEVEDLTTCSTGATSEAGYEA